MSGRTFQPHIITDDSASGGQIIDGSLKFNIARTNYLKRAPAVDGNKQVWTSSVWVKRTRIGVQQKILEAGSSGTFLSFEFQGDDKLQLYGYDGQTRVHLRTASLFRDTGAWYHIVVWFDGAEGEARLYVNGSQPPLDTNTQPTIMEYQINNNVNHSIGRSQTTNDYYFDGYLSQFYHLDGILRDASHFGYTDEASGMWRPKKYKRRSPNNGTQWRNGVSGNIYSGTTANIFSSDLTAIGIDGNGNASNNHLTVSSINVRASSVGVRVSNSSSDIQVSINGSVVGTVASGSMSNNVPKLFTFTFDETLVSTIKLQRIGSASGWFLYEIQLDETPLIDNNTSNMGFQGFYLPFDGHSVPTDDQSGNGNNFVAYQMRPTVPLTRATGALPIMRTNKGGSIALTGVRDDPYGSNCVVAVPGHNAFQDYSYQVGASTYKSFTTSGSPTISPQGAGQQGGQCLYRNSIKLVRSSSQYIEIPFSAFNLGTGDFTIECWAMHLSHGSDMNLFNLYDGSSRKFFVQARVNNSANDFHARFYGSSNQYNSNSIEWQNNDNALKVWYHVAVCRASGTFRIFLNGVLVSAEHNTGSEDLGNVDRLRVGYMASDGTKYWDGHVQDIRFYNTAKYTSNFSVPSGNSTIVADSPSGVAVERKFDYSVLDNGSVSFNAGTDALTIPYSADFDLGSSWTIEFWFYPYDTTNAKVMGTRGDSSPRGWEIVYWNGGFVGIEQYGDQSTSGQQRGTKKVHPLAWHHVAITHNGTNTRTYIDGFADLNYTGSSGSNWGAGSHNLRIGRPENFAEGGRFAISNVRIVKGTVVYTTNFTPQITPLTNITNTKLLCCNSNTSTAHATVSPTVSGPSITAVGGITHSTDDPYSSSEGSTSNSGTGYLRSVSDSYIIGAGDFTIECWLKSTNASGTNQEGIWSILSGSNDFSNSTANAIRFVQGRDGTASGQDGGLEVVINQEAMGTTGQDVLAENVWTHVAVSRQSGLVKIFVGGVEKASAYLKSNIPGNRFITGYYDNNYTFQGNMADLRFVNGRAVYTGNFTPPTSPLPNVPNAVLRACSSDSSATSSATVYSIPRPTANVYANDFNPFDVADTIGQESGYCILNVVDKQNNVTPSDGGLHWACSSGNDGKIRGILPFSSGKYYFEDTVGIASRHHVGVMATRAPLLNNAGDFSNRADEWGVRTDGFKVNNQTALGNDVGTDITNASIDNAQGYIWMVAVDADNGKIYFGKNGLWLAGANPYSGSNAHYTNLSGYELCAAMGRRSGANAANINFGQTPFVYNPPEGFKALCTSNIKHGPVRDPRQHFGAVLWTGNSSTSNRKISGLKFKPDLVWSKTRNYAYHHVLMDSVRGPSNKLNSDQNFTENFTTGGHLASFDDDGFTWQYGSGSGNEWWNQNYNYVAWAWKAGGNSNTFNIDGVGYATAAAAGLNGGTSNPTGASVNTEAGFSIISYTATNNQNVSYSHGLNQAPEIIITKNRDGTSNWGVYYTVLGTNTNWSVLNLTDAQGSNNSGTTPVGGSSGTFMYLHQDYFAPSYNAFANGSNDGNDKMIAYMWHSVPGYSKVGVFNGDSETDNTFIPCGFRPAFIIARSLQSAGGQWWMVDTKRDPDNVVYNMLDANRANAERTDTIYDINSNGFKVRLGLNTDNFIFLAFAEQSISNPFGGQSDAR